MWEFMVKPGKEKDFEVLNGSKGGWYQFFKHSPDFISTSLLKDENAARRYLTQDIWKSIEGFKEYVRQNKPDFDALDKANAELYENVKHLGYFNLL